MYWIYPLILLIVVSSLFIYYKYSESINKKLSQKKKYLRYSNSLKRPYRTLSNLTFTLGAVLLVAVVVLVSLPYTNGFFKTMSKDLQPSYLEENYIQDYDNARYQPMKETVSKLQPGAQNLSSVSLAKRVVFIDKNILVSKIIDGAETRYRYQEEYADYNLKLVLSRDYVITYFSYQVQNQTLSTIYVHNLSDLDVCEKIEIIGKIEKLSISSNLINVVVHNELIENDLEIIHLENHDQTHTLTVDNIYYISDCKVFQNVTFITVDINNFDVRLSSLYIGEYDVYLNNSLGYLVVNVLTDEKESQGLIIRYDFLIHLLSLKADLQGYVYGKLKFDNQQIQIETVECLEDEKIYHLYTFTNYLLKVREEVITVEYDDNTIACIAGGKHLTITAKNDEYQISLSEEVTYQLKENVQFFIENDKIYCFDTTNEQVDFTIIQIEESEFIESDVQRLDINSLGFSIQEIINKDEEIIVILGSDTQSGYLIIADEITCEVLEKEVTLNVVADYLVIIKENIYQYFPLK